MDLQLFKTFLLVGKLENISHAAEQLNFTQPTVTAQIQALESFFGVLLFERVGKKIFLTDAGRMMMHDAERLLHVIAEIHEDMEPFRKMNYSLTLGISTQMINYLLPPILKELQNRFPGIQVSIEVCKNTEEVLKRLLDNQLDLGIIHGQVHTMQVSQYNILNEKILWVASKKTISQHHNSQNISDYPIINFKKNCSDFRSKFDTAMKNKLSNTVIEYSDSAAVKHAVLNNLGISYLPTALVQEDINNGHLVTLPGPTMHLPISLVIHKNKQISSTIHAFLLTISELPRADKSLKKFLTLLK